MRSNIVASLIFIILLLPAISISEEIDKDSIIIHGYTVFLDAQQGRGFIFLNKTEESVLIVLYPMSDKSFIYSDAGKWTNDADFAYKLIHLQLEYIDENTIANIIPNYNKYKQSISPK